MPPPNSNRPTLAGLRFAVGSLFDTPVTNQNASRGDLLRAELHRALNMESQKRLLPIQVQEAERANSVWRDFNQNNDITEPGTNMISPRAAKLAWILRDVNAQPEKNWEMKRLLNRAYVL